ncbi:MAG: GAF domain-containing sensor histidine kinase [Acidimicrobiia bacterium]|nr:GAF domain-containing sensor histidine kinase [Acidimicrobiia bacterium]
MQGIATERLTRLFEAAAQVAGQADLRALLRTIVETASELTGAEYGAMGIIGSHGTLVEFLTVGIDEEIAAAIGPPPQGNGVLGTITRMAKTVRLVRIAEHPDSVGFPDGHPLMDTFLGVPVRASDHVYGNLYLTNKAGGFTDQDETMVEALALIGGSAVSTMQLQERLRRVAVVEDRERIARDAHDQIIQDLFAVGLSLQGLSLRADDAELSLNLASSVRRLDDAIASLRGFIFDLRRVPDVRDVEGELLELIHELGDAYDCRPRISIAGDMSALADSVIAVVFHIVKEATSNALRHAGTEAITASVMADGGTVVVQVSDNGVGFDARSVERGMGLDNLRSRAEEAGGYFEIQAAPGRGTTVRVELPFDTNQA